MNDTTWTLDGAKVTIEDERPFYDCDIEVLIEREYMYGNLVAKSYSGELNFSEPVDEDLFFNEDGHPKCLEVLAESTLEYIHLDAALCNRKDDSTVEFVANGGEKEVTTEPTETFKNTEDLAIELLDDLACEIVDGDVHVISVDRERDFGGGGGFSTLEVTYQ